MGERIFLAGDIGGTKTNLIAFSAQSGPRHPLAASSFTSAHFAGLADLAQKFLADLPFQVERACFGVAGPVINGCSKITNLPWRLDEKDLSAGLGIASVHLVNDLAATAASIPYLQPEDLKQIKTGIIEPHGQIAVIAPGTGLGEAFLAWDGRRYRAYASEGGHTDFAPTSDLERELLRSLNDAAGHVSYEHICSGQGLPRIYAFLRDSGYAAENQAFARQLAESDDPTPLIIQKALHDALACTLCSKTLQLFVSILAAEAGNLALKVLATGGVFIGGGIAPRILNTLNADGFRSSFTNKGKMSALVGNIPVQVILNSKAALLGAAAILLDTEEDDE